MRYLGEQHQKRKNRRTPLSWAASAAAPVVSAAGQAAFVSYDFEQLHSLPDGIEYLKVTLSEVDIADATNVTVTAVAAVLSPRHRPTRDHAGSPAGSVAPVPFHGDHFNVLQYRELLP